MHQHGKIVVIKRNGSDGAHFPLTAACCLFGRGLDSDIRIQLPNVDNEQCQIEVDSKGQIFMRNIGQSTATLLNDKLLPNSLVVLSHGDIITIVDRKFRFELSPTSQFYPGKSPSKNSKSPGSSKSPGGKVSASGTKSPKAGKETTPIKILSPRTDNVPSSSKSPKKLSETPMGGINKNNSATPTAHQSPKKSGVGAPDFLFGLSPTSFYNASFTPRALKKLGDEQAAKGLLNASNKKQSPGQRPSSSPFPKGHGDLRKSISDLRRRSTVLFEENLSQSPNETNTKEATPQESRKRKSPEFHLPSAKRKRVSFGPKLSPEHFDKQLPPKTPVKKGATPTTKSNRKSLLKKKSPKITSPKVVTPKQVTPLKSASLEGTPRVASPKGTPRAGSPKGTPRAVSPKGTPKQATPRAVSPKGTPKQATPRAASPKGTPRAVSPKGTPKQATPRAASPKGTPRAVSPKGTPKQATPRAASPKGTPKQATPRAASPKGTPKQATPRATLPQGSSKQATPRVVSPKGTPKQTTPNSTRKALSGKKATPKHASPRTASPKRTPKADLIETPKSSKKKLGSPVIVGGMNDSLLFSQDLFSQANALTPKPSAGKETKEVKTVSPLGLKRLMKTPKEKQVRISAVSPVGLTRLVKTPKIKKVRQASVSPTGIKRLVQTPKDKRSRAASVSPAGLKRLVQTPKEKMARSKSVSPSGIERLVKSPKVKRAGRPSVSPTGLKRLMKTPKGKQAVQTSLTGLKEMMKTPKAYMANDLNLSGVTDMLQTPATSVEGSSGAFSKIKPSSTPKHHKVAKMIDTPRPQIKANWKLVSNSPKEVFLSPKAKTPKSTGKKNRSGKKATPKSPLKLATMSPGSKKKMLSKFKSPSEKIIAPPQDINKVVALRAIHGHGVTPMLSQLNRKSSSAKKPMIKSWSDIVKGGKPAPKLVAPAHRPVIIKKAAPSAFPMKRAGKTPKTPRALARALAPSTGHAASPATILVGKKALGRGRPKTPAPLPKKGRKKSMSKFLQTSPDNTSFTGVSEMLQTPKSGANDSALYADIPDTPNGPNEMFVSPMSTKKIQRKSMNLVGVRNLFKGRKSQPEAHLTGIKDLLAEPKEPRGVSSPSGLARLFETPEAKGASSPRKETSAKKAITALLAQSPTPRESTDSTEVTSPKTARGKRPMATEPESSSPQKKAKIQSPVAVQGSASKSKVSPLPVKTRTRKGKTPAKSAALAQVESFSPKQLPSKTSTRGSRRQAAPSPKLPPTKTAVRGGRRAVVSPKQSPKQINKNVLSPTVTDNSLAPKSPPAKRGRRGQKLLSPKPSPAKATARGKRAKVAPSSNIIPVQEMKEQGLQEPSQPDSATHGGKGQSITSPKPSPVKTQTRGRRGKTIPSPKISPVKAKGRVRKTRAVPPPMPTPAKEVVFNEKETVVGSIPTEVALPLKPSPAKAPTRGRRVQAAPSPKPSPAKAPTRGRKAAPSPKPSPAKAPTRGRKAAPSPKPSPAKAPTRGRRGQAAPSPKPSPAKAPTRGRRGQAAPSPKPSPAKAPTRGRRGQAAPSPKPSPAKAPTRGRKAAPSPKPSPAPVISKGATKRKAEPAVKTSPKKAKVAPEAPTKTRTSRVAKKVASPAVSKKAAKKVASPAASKKTAKPGKSKIVSSPKSAKPSPVATRRVTRRK
ncbi:hypothetical protein EGW08_019680 [Elysia chlorotica]|uniref:FHA domain-containing protein n=1 Tax=Elysia chlorotica TaxID=188477 RepID=A0A433STF8_ELYCH|nr:hypothetical protein EGW08_019680 [Elysia chlorotica]